MRHRLFSRESPEPSPAARAEEFEALRQEIVDLKKRESEKGFSIHLRDVNPEELTEADLTLWRFVREGKLGAASEAMNTLFSDYVEQVRHSGNSSRNHFLGFLGNTLSVSWGRQEILERLQHNKK